MPLLRYLSLTLLIPLLNGCEPKVEPAKVEPEKAAPAVVAEPAPAVAAEQPVIPVEPVRRPKAAVPAAPVASNAEKAPPPAELDLSLPPELMTQVLAEQGDGQAALAPLLPPLFEDRQPPVGPFQLSGRLITNEADEDYWKSLDGAELQFEFKR